MIPVKRIWIALSIALLVMATEADVTNKRIPSGFMGMRGKKSMDISPYDDNFLQVDYDKLPYLGDNSRFADSQPDMYYGYSLKRAPMGFQGMRGKKNYLMDTGPLPRDMADSFYGEDAFEKRGPMGFQGMRGKREFEYPILAYPNKRGPLGFQGMRGKKSNDLSDEYLHTFDGENSNDNNLAPPPAKSDKPDALNAEQASNAASVEASDSLIGAKQRRAQNVGFYGVRGKKMPSTLSFFGMRGKKGPFDFPFRGKFVGVRGKKLSNDRPSDLQMLAERLAWTDDSFAKRRGPSGFVGMRGKKWIAADGDVSQAMSASNDNEEE